MNVDMEEENYDDTNVRAIFDSMMNRIQIHKDEMELKNAQNGFMTWLQWYLGIRKHFVDLPFVDFK